MTDKEKQICKFHLKRVFYYVYRTELNLSPYTIDDYFDSIEAEITDYLCGGTHYKSIEQIMSEYLGLSGEYAKIFLP